MILVQYKLQQPNQHRLREKENSDPNQNRKQNRIRKLPELNISRLEKIISRLISISRLYSEPS